MNLGSFFLSEHRDPFDVHVVQGIVVREITVSKCDHSTIHVENDAGGAVVIAAFAHLPNLRNACASSHKDWEGDKAQTVRRTKATRFLDFSGQPSWLRRKASSVKRTDVCFNLVGRIPGSRTEVGISLSYLGEQSSIISDVRAFSININHWSCVAVRNLFFIIVEVIVFSAIDALLRFRARNLLGRTGMRRSSLTGVAVHSHRRE
jgi:hypothetical protein